MEIALTLFQTSANPHNIRQGDDPILFEVDDAVPTIAIIEIGHRHEI